MNVLFVCVGNSGRSVMAERLFRRAAAGRHGARSAGADPHGTGAEPAVVEALPDPYGQPLERVRAIRDEIARRVEALAAELDA